MERKMKIGIFLAVLAATLYAINAPFSKLLLSYMPPTLMAGTLYIGAGLGMGAVATIRRLKKTERTKTVFSKSELPYVVAMVVLDILAPVCLLLGLRATTAASASLLNNFEIVATSVIALCAFREKITKKF